MHIQISQLSNGLRIITDYISNVETVALGVWVKAGSRLETQENNGVAHFLEHMAFKGTTSRTAAELAQSIENVGGYMNASTSRETTAYYMRLLQHDIPLGMEILGDILLHSTFNETELERERGVISQELGMTLDTPDDLVFDYYQQTAFPDQPLGQTILGPAKNIKSFQRAHLCQFMDTYYVPEQMVFSASGRVDHHEIVKLAEKYFKDLSRSPVTHSPAKGHYKGGEKIEQKSLEQLHFLLGFQGIEITNENYYALSVLTAILGGGMSSRLFQHIRENLGLVYTIYAFKACYADTGTVGIYASTGAEEVKSLIPALIDEIKKICDYTTPEELKRSKAQLKAGLLMGLESTSNRCEYLANQLLFYGSPLLTQDIIHRIDAVHTEQLLHLAQQIFRSPLTLAALGPAHNLCSVQTIAEQLR